MVKRGIIKFVIMIIIFLILSYFIKSNPGSTMNVTISKPLGLQNITLREIFNVTSKVTCQDTNCGDVMATVRFNLSNSLPFTPVNNTFNQTPIGIINSKFPKNLFNRTVSRTDSADGSLSDDRLFDVTLDNGSNIYFSGSDGDVLDGGFLIMKMNSTGKMLWNVSYRMFSGISTSRYANGITLDNSSNIYIVADFGSLNSTIIKLDSEGKNIWNRTYPGAFSAGLNDVVSDYNNNIYAVGSQTSDSIMRIMKVNSNGLSIWNRTYNPGIITDVAYSVVMDKNKTNLFVAGTTNSGEDNFRIMKIRTDGKSIWNRTFDPGNDDIAYGITADSLNNLYVVGVVSDVNWYFMKLTSSGKSILNRTFNPGGTDVAMAVSIDSLNNAYIVGKQGSGGDSASRIMKLDVNGNSVWNRTYNTSGVASSDSLSDEDIFRSVAINKFNDIYIAGIFSEGGAGDANGTIFKFDNSLSYQSCGNLNIGQSCTFEWNINASRKGAYKIGVFYNSTSAAPVNVTDNQSIQVSGYPFFVNITKSNRDVYHINTTAPTGGHYVNISIKISTDRDLSHYRFSTNNTGVWTNYTWVKPAGTQINQTNWTRLESNNTKLSRYGWKYYANDTAGNLNKSSINTFLNKDVQKPILRILSIPNNSLTPIMTLNTTDDYELDKCWYNLTFQATPNVCEGTCPKYFTCATSATVTGLLDGNRYSVWISANDTSGNVNLTRCSAGTTCRKNITVDVTPEPGGGGSSGGAGGGGGTIVIRSGRVYNLTKIGGLKCVPSQISTIFLFTPFTEDIQTWRYQTDCNIDLDNATFINTNKFNLSIISNSSVLLKLPIKKDNFLFKVEKGRLKIADIGKRNIFMDVEVTIINLSYNVGGKVPILAVVALAIIITAVIILNRQKISRIFKKPKKGRTKQSL